jgi:hypothetical protein
MNTKTSIILGCTALALLAGGAQASMVQVRDALGGESSTGSPGGKYLDGTGILLRGTADGGPAGFFAAGTFDFEADFGDGFDELLTYCLEPLVDIAFGDAPADSGGWKYAQTAITDIGLSPLDIDFIQILWANAFDLSKSGHIEAGAFQSFIWEITQDGALAFNVDAGNYDMLLSLPETAASAALATEWFDKIVSGEWNSSTQLAALTDSLSQNLLYQVPAPGSAALAAISLGLMSGRRRRNA